jgi:glycerophosphoryl diester phosphodiesterase
MKANPIGIEGIIFFQAHRGGGGYEMPDNTIAACKYGWDLGAIPEIDVRNTKDGKIICLHDDTLRRTTNAGCDIADKPVELLNFDDIKNLDAGSYFSPQYKKERIPLLTDIFNIMKNNERLYLYIDLKKIDSKTIIENIKSHNMEKQCILCSSDISLLLSIKDALPSSQLMQWIGGSKQEIEQKFHQTASHAIKKLDQIQIHLNDKEKPDKIWRYTADKDFLENALEITRNCNVDLEVFPWHFEKSDIFNLLDIGIRWFATDRPKQFYSFAKEWLEKMSRVINFSSSAFSLS